MITETEVKILRDYVAGADFTAMAKKYRIHLDVVVGIVRRVNFQRAQAAELLRQRSFGVDVSLPPSLEVPRAAAPKAGRAPAMAAAPTRPAAADEAAPPAAGATARAGFGLKTPRRPAAVGGDDAVEEVTAVSGATGAAVTGLPETAAVVAPDTAAALDDIAALVEQVLDRALFFTVRWYCPSCISWPLDPGACRTCKSALQPVYLATLPREVPL